MLFLKITVKLPNKSGHDDDNGKDDDNVIVYGFDAVELYAIPCER